MKNSKFAFVALVLASAIAAGSTGCTRKAAENPNHKVLNLALGDDVKSLDPAIAYDSVSLTVVPMAMESLYQYAYLKTPLELEPLLAESMPQVSKDQKTYTIKVRKGVMWQDDAAFPGGKGRELKAGDFIYAWKRMLVPTLQSPGTWLFEGKVAGYNELKDKLSKSREKTEEILAEVIDGLKAVDDYTIRIQLTQPYPQLLHALAMGFGSPMAKEVTEKYGHDGFTERMVGTGPYRLKQLVKGSKIILEKNPTFRGEKYPAVGDEDAKNTGLLAAAGSTLPLTDEVIFHVFKEDQPQWLQFLSGNLDASGIPKDNFSAAIEKGKLKADVAAKGIQLRTAEEAVIWYLNFNMKDKLLGSNANLRKAISRAINREEYIDLFLNGRGVKAMSIVPRTIPGYSGRTELANDYNIAEAKKLLEKAGYPGGKGLPAIRYDLRGSSTTARQQAEFIKKALSEIGVNLQIEINSFPAYLEKEKNGNLQFFMGGWNADYPDAENFLFLLYSKNVSPGPNASNYVNAEFDKLYEKIAVMTPSAERTALIKKAEELVFNEGVWSMMFYPVRYSLSHGWLKNFRPHSQIINDVKYYDIDAVKKGELKGKLKN